MIMMLIVLVLIMTILTRMMTMTTTQDGKPHTSTAKGKKSGQCLQPPGTKHMSYPNKRPFFFL